MQIPNKIEQLINKRQKLAEQLNSADVALSNWMEKQGIDMGECSDFTRTGCMIYCEPDAAAKNVRDAITNHTERKSQ